MLIPTYMVINFKEKFHYTRLCRIHVNKVHKIGVKSGQILKVIFIKKEVAHGQNLFYAQLLTSIRKTYNSLSALWFNAALC